MDKSDADTDTPHDYIELAAPLRARYLRLENVHMPAGYFALSGLRVFGFDPEAKAPAAPKKARAVRSKDDRRDVMFTWKPSEGAYGYNIYYGTAPDKLYNAITVIGDTIYDMRGLDRDTDYYYAIEAIGEGGKSPRVTMQTKQ